MIFPKRFLILFTSLILSSQAWSAGSQGRAEIAFSRGLLHYSGKNTVKAERDFSAALQNDPRHAEAAYFLGRISFDRADYTKASSFFRKSIASRSDQAEPYFYLGLSQYRLKKSAEALVAFRRAEEIAEAGQIKDLSKSYRRSLEGGSAPIEKAVSPSAQTQRNFFLYGSVGIFYDSNVSLLPDGLTLTTAPSDRNDAQINARLGGGYHLLHKSNHTLTAEASYAQTFYPSLTDFDYGTAHVEARWQLRQKRFSFLLPAYYEFSLLKTTKYLHNINIAPSVSVSLNPHVLLQLSQKLRYDFFFQGTLTNGEQNRDALNLQTEPAVYFFWNSQKGVARIAYTFETNRSRGDDWQYDGHTLSAFVSHPIVWDIRGTACASYTFQKNFDHVDSVIGEQRKDTFQNYSGTISKDFLKNFTTSLQYSYQRNNSNIDFFQYDRHLAGVSFAYRY